MVNVPQNIPGISYSTQSRDWNDNTTFNTWLEEQRAISKEKMNRTCHMFADNCVIHVAVSRSFLNLLKINFFLIYI